MPAPGDFDGCRFDFRIDSKKGLMPSHRRRGRNNNNNNNLQQQQQPQQQSSPTELHAPAAAVASASSLSSSSSPSPSSSVDSVSPNSSTCSTNTLYNCRQCGVLLTSRSSLIEHRATHHHQTRGAVPQHQSPFNAAASPPPSLLQPLQPSAVRPGLQQQQHHPLPATAVALISVANNSLLIVQQPITAANTTATATVTLVPSTSQPPPPSPPSSSSLIQRYLTQLNHQQNQQHGDQDEEIHTSQSADDSQTACTQDDAVTPAAAVSQPSSSLPVMDVTSTPSTPPLVTTETTSAGLNKGAHVKRRQLNDTVDRIWSKKLCQMQQQLQPLPAAAAVDLSTTATMTSHIAGMTSQPDAVDEVEVDRCRRLLLAHQPQLASIPAQRPQSALIPAQQRQQRAEFFTTSWRLCDYMPPPPPPPPSSSSPLHVEQSAAAFGVVRGGLQNRRPISAAVKRRRSRQRSRAKTENSPITSNVAVVVDVSPSSNRLLSSTAGAAPRPYPRQYRQLQYACDFDGCRRSFRELKHLKVHRMQHTDERPLSCSLCNYACRQRNSLNWHMKSRHGLAKQVTADGRTVYVDDSSLSSDQLQHH